MGGEEAAIYTRLERKGRVTGDSAFSTAMVEVQYSKRGKDCRIARKRMQHHCNARCNADLQRGSPRVDSGQLYSHCVAQR